MEHSLRDLDLIYCALMTARNDKRFSIIKSPESEWDNITKEADEIDEVMRKIQKETFRLEDAGAEYINPTEE